MKTFSDLPGYLCLYEDESKKIENIDYEIVALFGEQNLRKFTVPVLISKDILSKCNYFEKFPQQVVHTGFCCQTESVDLSSVAISEGYYLLPAACLHIYPMLANETIMDNQIITTKAKVFRNEQNNYSDLKRHMDFTVREFVFVGTHDYVKNSLDHYKEKTLEYLKEKGIDSKLCIATDNFYNSRKNQLIKKLQVENKLKYELVVNRDDSEVAIASFNYHGTHFSEAFGFDNDNKIVTGCIGFGLERWLLL